MQFDYVELDHICDLIKLEMTVNLLNLKTIDFIAISILC